MEIKNIFGLVLREKRESCNISQEKLANSCGLDRTYISLLERGKRNVTIKVLFNLCAELKVSPSEIIKEIEDRISK